MRCEVLEESQKAGRGTDVMRKGMEQPALRDKLGMGVLMAQDIKKGKEL